MKYAIRINPITVWHSIFNLPGDKFAE